MKSPCSSSWQRGTSLPMALVVLAVGVLLVSPFLGYLATSYRSTLAVEETLYKEHDSDAGTEYAIWKLGDPTFRPTLVAAKGTPQEVLMPEPVNTIAPTVEMVFIEPIVDWSWSVWVSDTLTIEKKTNNIYGDVSYGGEIVDGNGFTISDTDEMFHGDVVSREGGEDWPVSWDIADFQPGGVEALAAGENYHLHEESENTWDGTRWIVDSADDLPTGLHYYPGDLKITNSNQTWLDVTLVTTGTIHVDHGNSLTFRDPYVDGLTLFANADSMEAIKIDGNSFTVEGGICYAPNGTIVLGANTGTFFASLVSKDVLISKNNTDLDLFVPDPSSDDFCGLYDIRSVADGITTTVRLTRCGQSSPSVLSWSTY